MAATCQFRLLFLKFFSFKSVYLPVLVMITVALAILPVPASGWGFWAHKRINRLAVFRLPPEMQVFYKPNIDYLTDNATNPDKRRYSVVGEAERHFIDLDVYGDIVFQVLPKLWKDAVMQVGEDSLRKHGIVPWHIQLAVFQLTEAFRKKEAARILRLSAELGHYVADAHVPLHTTRNYNGQFSGQDGIHGLWESRLPELFADRYELWIGKAAYRDRVSELAWQIVRDSHTALDSVLAFEKLPDQDFDTGKKYSYELRNNVLTRSYSRAFCERYHLLLAGQVERRMKSSVEVVGDLWYTCWINAGQPDLKEIARHNQASGDSGGEDPEKGSWVQRLFGIRPEGDDD